MGKAHQLKAREGFFFRLLKKRPHMLFTVMHFYCKQHGLKVGMKKDITMQTLIIELV